MILNLSQHVDSDGVFFPKAKETMFIPQVFISHRTVGTYLAYYGAGTMLSILCT